MSNITFEWDASKASLNKKKHGISFDEAKTVFFDEKAKVIHDPEHSDDEERFIILGLRVNVRMLVVILPEKPLKKNQLNIMVVGYEKRI